MHKKTLSKSFMLQMLSGQRFDLSKMKNEDDMKTFKDMCIEIIQENWFNFGWQFEFNKDYSILRRITTEKWNVLIVSQK